MNKIADKYLLVEDTFITELHLMQVGITYSSSVQHGGIETFPPPPSPPPARRHILPWIIEKILDKKVSYFLAKIFKSI